MYREIIIIIVFLAGLIFCFSGKQNTGKQNKKTIKENFIGTNNCPNLLLQSGNEIFLFNSNRAHIPGVNPIKFNNLDEYVEFMKWQKQVGIKCPVLYLQHTYDAQNNLGWRPLSNPLEPNAGMLTGPMPGSNQETLLYDANRLDPPYNEADFPAYDPENQYIGDSTPLDKMFNEVKPPSNPMDTGYVSQRSLDKGYYTQKNGSQTQPLQYNSQSQYTRDNMLTSSQPRDNNAEYTQQMMKNQMEQNSFGGNRATPQTSSMAQYVGTRSNAPDANIENPPASSTTQPMSQYIAQQDQNAIYGGRGQSVGTYGSTSQTPSMSQYIAQQDRNTLYAQGQSNTTA